MTLLSLQNLVTLVAVALVFAGAYMARTDVRKMRGQWVDWWLGALVLTMVGLPTLSLTVGFAWKTEQVRSTDTIMVVAEDAGSRLLDGEPAENLRTDPQLAEYTPIVVQANNQDIAELEKLVNDYRNGTANEQQTFETLQRLADTATEPGERGNQTNDVPEGELAWIWLNGTQGNQAYCVGAGGITGTGRQFRVIETEPCSEAQTILYNVAISGTGSEKLRTLTRLYEVQDQHTEQRQEQVMLAVLAIVFLIGAGILIHLFLQEQLTGQDPRYWKLAALSKDGLPPIYRQIQGGLPYTGNWIGAAGVGVMGGVATVAVIQTGWRLAPNSGLFAVAAVYATGLLAGALTVLGSHIVLHVYRGYRARKAGERFEQLLTQPYTYYGWQGVLALIHSGSRALGAYGIELIEKHPEMETAVAAQLNSTEYSQYSPNYLTHLTYQELAALIQQVKAITSQDGIDTEMLAGNNNTSV